MLVGNQIAGTQVDLSGLKSKVLEFSRRWGTDANAVMGNQMRLWCADLMKRFPNPRGMKKAQVDKAIKADLRKVFAIASTRSWLRFERARFGKYTDIFEEQSEKKMYMRHQAQRSKATGRVSANRGMVAFGAMSFPDKPHIYKTEFKKYERDVLSRVGRLASGWLAGFRKWQWARDVKNPNSTARGPARWITRHGSLYGEAGGAIDQSGNGSLYAINHVPHYNMGKLYDATERTRTTRYLDLKKWLAVRLKLTGQEVFRKAA